MSVALIRLRAKSKLLLPLASKQVRSLPYLTSESLKGFIGKEFVLHNIAIYRFDAVNADACNENFVILQYKDSLQYIY